MTNNGELHTATGRRLALQSLEQSLVYEGLLEGLPTREMNRGIIESLKERVRASGPEALHLIPPVEKELSYPGEPPYPFGEPAVLPGISCVARFHSHSSDNEVWKYSELTVIWFQDDFAFPIAPEILEALQHLEWEKLAVDLEL